MSVYLVRTILVNPPRYRSFFGEKSWELFPDNWAPIVRSPLVQVLSVRDRGMVMVIPATSKSI